MICRSCDRSLSSQPISIPKVQSRKKCPQTFAHLVNFCLPCLIIIQSCYFDYRINRLSHVLAAWSAFRALFTWSRPYERKGSWAFFILITHKSTRSENPITWDPRTEYQRLTNQRPTLAVIIPYSFIPKCPSCYIELWSLGQRRPAVT